MKKKRCAAVIPLYRFPLNSDEILSIQQYFNVLKECDIYFIGPQCLEKQLLDLYLNYSNNDSNIILYEDSNFVSINSYNKLMLDIRFYNDFIEYEYILISQTDALALRDEINYWCNKNYSYIGAPWCKMNSNGKLSYLGVGNGGFSLRKTKDFIGILSKKNILLPLKYSDLLLFNLPLYSRLINYLFKFKYGPLKFRMNEDLFWGLIAPRMDKNFIVPTSEIASHFSFEKYPKEIFTLNELKLPFGCHAWNKYDHNFWLKNIPEILGAGNEN